MARRAGALAVAALVALAGPVVADDEVILKDGTSIQGEVIEERPDLVRVRVARGQDRVILELPGAQVHWVRRLREEHARLLRDAEAALVKGDVAAAVSGLQAVAAALPQDARAQRELGFALLLRNEHAAAAEALERAVALDPIDFESHLQLAQVHEALGHPEAALARYRRAATLGPRHTVAWRALARLLLAQGGPRQRDEALDALVRAAREAPDDEAILAEQVAALLPGWTAGPVQADAPTLARARGALELHVSRRPAAPGPTLLLARLLAGSGDPARARDLTTTLAQRAGVAPLARERARAEAALYAWLVDGLPGLAPPPLDTGAPGVDPAWAARGLDLLLADLPWPAVEGRLLVARARVALRAARRDQAGAWLERAALSSPAPDVMADALLLQEVLVALDQAPPPPVFGGPQVSAAKARRVVALVPWLAQSHETLGRALERDGAFDLAAGAFDAAAARAATPEERKRLEAAGAAAREAHARRARTRGL